MEEEVSAPEPKSYVPDSTGNPKLDAWMAVRIEWQANHRVTPSLVALESAAKKAKDTR